MRINKSQILISLLLIKQRRSYECGDDSLVILRIHDYNVHCFDAGHAVRMCWILSFPRPIDWPRSSVWMAMGQCSVDAYSISKHRFSGLLFSETVMHLPSSHLSTLICPTELRLFLLCSFPSVCFSPIKNFTIWYSHMIRIVRLKQSLSSARMKGRYERKYTHVHTWYNISTSYQYYNS